MKCEACEFYAGGEHCWVNSKGVEPCPEKACDKFKYERVAGECVTEERDRIIALIEAKQREADEKISSSGCSQEENRWRGASEIYSALVAELRGEK